MILSFLQIALGELFLLGFISYTKLARPLPLLDFLYVALIALVLERIASFGLVFAIGAALIGTGLFVALWLDAVLWAVFTIELGPGGVGGVVVSMLYRELSEISHARRFFRRNPAFTCLPFGAAIAHLPLVIPGDRTQLAIALAGYAVLVAIDEGRKLGQHKSQETSATTAVVKNSMLADFFRARPLADDPDFEPRPEHTSLLGKVSESPGRSVYFGTLTGKSIVLITLESVGRHHLYFVSSPYLRSLSRRSVVSERHFSPSPTTNNAHLALLFSDYFEAGEVPKHRLGGAALLSAAGYRTVYASAITTEHYGLRAIVEQAGFEEIVDRARFVPEPIERGSISDWALVKQLPQLLREREDDRPLFLHVHFTNTHVPYRVVDEARFSRRKHDDDRERFFDGIEEADAMIQELVASISAQDSLLIVTSDHGQAFGELGYQSHGSAVIKEEIEVPLLLAHPEIGHREIASSTHFDVLPTILDLAGIDDPRPSAGVSMFIADRKPQLFVWAGHPSRTTTSNFGLIDGERKIMIDLVTGLCSESGLDERDLRHLEDDEAEYWRVLLTRIMKAKGVR